MTYFEYGQKEINYLKRKEPILGKEIDRLDKVKRKTKPDVFAALISSIISQQVSTQLAQTVESRLKKVVGKITPANLHQLTREEIQQCGMSMRKADYIKGIAEKAVFNEIDFDHLHQLTNQEIMTELVSLKGVGEWTESLQKELVDTNLHIHGIYISGMNTNFWGDELQDESETGLMNPDDVADLVIFNTQERTNMSVPKIIIENL